ncbi:DNA mismatch repair protein MutL [Halolactibacillus halophilus]|uniref:DNA mismatch repair protein MutL n=1 Tax=Halolactibacillus halophilus TaxID=306540 RepID=A0A1I5LFN4_9BACI|nr:DNA mismatch repair protein MutL [Halolactibacillus halophilus]SFO96174.1 DNA mismatch repair protein MutL [Halolactibacillus halophilus]
MAIELMSDALSNKIAAGEVVERPASVIKELVENSIDANSQMIKVDVYEAGLMRMKVTDDGDGMLEEDASVAFLRHATSKIKSEQDLFHVRTLGFRGEALASIAAVSKLTLKTSTGDGAGTLIQYEGGKEVNRDKADARKGTEITVDQLFFNTPARLKYMKTIHTELGHITDVINRLSLSHPDIRFTLTHNDKVIFKSNGRGDLLQIIAQIYGINVAKKMIKIEHDTLDYKISGYIAKPEVTRSGRQYLSTLINGRFVRSVILNKAILSGYHTLLPIGRHPIVVIQIEMDPILVDVNVHPTKLDVRFSKEKELFTAIETAIKEAFKQERLIPDYTEKKQKPKQDRSKQASFSFDHTPSETSAHNQLSNSRGRLTQQESKEDVQHEANDIKQHYEETLNAPRLNQPQEREAVTEDTLSLDQQISPNLSETVHENAQPLMPSTDDVTSVDRTSDETKAINDSGENSRMPLMYPVGQHHGTYIIAENDQGMYLIDQHAAQERIKYEYYRDKIVEVDPVLQELLVPMTFDFSKQEALLIEQYQTELETVGLFFEPFGQQTYRVSAHPNWFPAGFEEETIRDIIAQIIEDEKIDLKKLREDAAILMACKKSIKANHHLNYDDMFELLETLRKTEAPFTCPHGRPVVIHFSTYELEKMFKRIM